MKVADLDALLNRTRRRRTHSRHHQTQIMARASQRNEDRAAILLHNNPLPQLAYDTADDLSPATVSAALYYLLTRHFNPFWPEFQNGDRE